MQMYCMYCIKCTLDFEYLYDKTNAKYFIYNFSVNYILK